MSAGVFFMVDANSQHGAAYCADIVRDYDADRYLASMVMPQAARPALWALFAFNHEIAKTREVVTETQLGLIRLQWWRDALAAIYEGGEGAVPVHEVVQPLAAAIKAYDLPRDLLERVIFAREFDLEDRSPADMAGLLNYADYTVTPLLQLAERIISGADISAGEARKIAVPYAVTGLLRAVPFHARQRRCYLPQELLTRYKIDLRLIYDPRKDELAGRGEKLRPVAADIMEGGYVIFEKSLIAAAYDKSRPFMKATAVQARIFAMQLENTDYDVFNPRLRLPPAFYHLRFMLGFIR